MIPDPLGRQGLHGLAVTGNLALVGTTLAGNGLPAQPDARPNFGVYDLSARRGTPG